MAKSLVICLGGSATVDQIFLVDEVRMPPAKIAASRFVVTGGGMAANAAVAVQRLGGQAQYWGRVGDDALGHRVIAMLSQEGVDVHAVRRLEGYRTKISSVLIDARGERLVVSAQPQGYPPDAAWLPLSEVVRAEAVLADSRWLNGSLSLFNEAERRDLPSILDADGGEPEAVLPVARRATHPVFSETMLKGLGFGAPDEALPRAFGGRNRICGVTLGGEGVRWFDGHTLHRRPAPKVKAVDTLGAGDTWHGAFALALAEDQPLLDAIDFASAAAALKCTRFGGREGIPTREQLDHWREGHAV